MRLKDNDLRGHGQGQTDVRMRKAWIIHDKASHFIVGYLIPVGLFLLLWQVASNSFGVEVLFPPPSTTFKKLILLIKNGSLIRDILASMWRILFGFTIGSILGIFFGLLMGSFPMVRNILNPYVNFLRFVSGVAWISVLIVWFGIGETSKVILIIYVTIFTVLINTMAGVASVSVNKLRAARCLGASEQQIFRFVTLPATIRYIVTGMRMSMANSFLTIVAAEMVQADSGLGFLIIISRNFLETDSIFSGMITLGFLGLLMDRILMFVSRTSLWRYHLEG